MYGSFWSYVANNKDDNIFNKDFKILNIDNCISSFSLKKLLLTPYGVRTLLYKIIKLPDQFTK